ncbi:ATP-binding protein [Streptomyces sp. NPDC059862]|uniref:ATP-binding protein n=1 Tax=unclassified Streptomyces TaxID=2593676 RepID=UPI00363CDD9D
MKQSAAKSLGVAALGAAFAAAGAGAANAAPAAPDATQALDAVTRTLPTENVSQSLPGAGKALAKGQPALGKGLNAVKPGFQKELSGAAAPVTGLLGGMPVQATGPGAKGLPVNGLPLG